MYLIGEQLQIASMINAKMQKLVCDGNDDLTILGEMFDYMPGFKRLMDISEPDTMDELCRQFAGFFCYAKSLKWWQPAFSCTGLLRAFLGRRLSSGLASGN